MNLKVIVISVLASLSPSATAAIVIPTVPIGNAGNAADTRVMNDGTTGYGSVAYTYNIGSTEVTNAQYAAFLNAVAATDSNNLYNPEMAGSFGGITRSGVDGSYTYATVSGRASNPVNFVSFWSATRFANWLHNGQPNGVQNGSTTEDGAYTLNSQGTGENTVNRNATWQWAVTSEDEWYKAAYHQPASQGGDASEYWLYTTSSNSMTTTTEANFGNVIGNTTPVGSYAANFYGAFDMGGNVMEWTDTRWGGFFRGNRGGWFGGSGIDLRADTFLSNDAIGPSQWDPGVGFRVSQVPAPSSVATLAIGGLVAARRRKTSTTS